MLPRILVYIHTKWQQSSKATRMLLRVAFAFTTVWVLILVGLVELWYPAGGRVGFHWFDDHAEWLQMDKLGHFFCTFHFAMGWAYVLRFGGIPRKMAAWVGAVIAFLTMLPIEVMDGFSPAYGASLSDLLANTLGATAVVVQSYFFEWIPIMPKFSFHPTHFAALRPALLGNSWWEQIFKDYNGQTIWFVADVNTLVRRKIFPSWLRLAIGVGAEGLLGGHDNVWQSQDGKEINFSDVTRYRQLYISVDINWGKSPRNHWLVRSLWHVLHWIKCPAPTLEFNAERGMVWHWIYF